MTSWLEVVVDTSVADADEVAAELADANCGAESGTQVRGTQVIFWVPADEREVALERTRAAIRGLQSRGLPVDPERVSMRSAAPEEEWRDAWKKHFHVTRLTEHIVVVPSWESHEPADGDVVIDLDPGQAFGTGAHASTQLVLEALETHRKAGGRVARFCDVGCGSGILSIAIAKLWPGAAGVAVDIDSLAVDATAENAADNGVGDRIEASSRAAGDIDERFDLVVANIQAHVLGALRSDISALVAPGGTLMLSGLLTTQAAEVAETYRRELGGEPATLTTSRADPEWTAAVLQRPPTRDLRETPHRTRTGPSKKP